MSRDHVFCNSTDPKNFDAVYCNKPNDLPVIPADIIYGMSTVKGVLENCMFVKVQALPMELQKKICEALNVDETLVTTVRGIGITQKS